METAAPSKGTAAAVPPGRRTAGRLLLAFIATLLLLTLFSNTLLQYSLPQVSVKMPIQGMLQYKKNGSGTIKPVETFELRTEAEWPIKELKVKVGDSVRKNQPLLELDTEEARNTLDTEELSYQQLKINLEKLQLDYKQAVYNGDEQQQDSLALDLESARLSLEAQKLKVNRLREKISRGSVMTSSADGVVTELNVSVGGVVPAGTPAVKVASLAGGFLFHAVLSEEETELLRVGDALSITVPELDDASLQGKIQSIQTPAPESPGGKEENPPASGQKEVTATVSDKRLRGGESATFEWVRKTQQKKENMLLPLSAIRESEDDGTFVYLLEERKGALGTEYYLRTSKVTVKDTDDKNALIGDGVAWGEQVVVSGDSSLKDGKRVRVDDATPEGG
ncbi:efflux RND transporter periplasmic adaptor subunit [Paenibacillus oralis]|uniref:Efflux RND transporter periplasmic adaptor subunit n=1 Tax=Paenibacillus oralis TaxID=2490856 RepID=A0A3P3UCM2_9BACL|nr:efflux RND transporter periplasmic adaptor subunit [Paenibacillus oralis]RRJ67299.1 efflux RND transporter periplasmic adaptor subunit [Paenibacillus oralis]